MRLRVLLSALALAAVLVPLASGATTGRVDRTRVTRLHLADSPDLWATINVCDTPAHPDTIGIRGSMPGLKRPSAVWMRFKVQYLATATDGKWHDVATGSHWRRLKARLKGRVVEAGQNFQFQPPAAGGAHRLRGVVQFKWVRSGRVVARQRKVTEGGHRSTAGADPEGYSAALCDIT